MARIGLGLTERTATYLGNVRVYKDRLPDAKGAKITRKTRKIQSNPKGAFIFLVFFFA